MVRMLLIRNYWSNINHCNIVTMVINVIQDPDRDLSQINYLVDY